LVASGNTNGASFTLKWTAATDNVGVTAYEIRRDSTSLGTASGTSLSITGLTQGVAYAMTVRARDAAGNWSAWSASLLVTTPDLTAPSVPTGLASSANTSGTSFTLSWTSATDNVGVTAYEVSKNGVSLGTTTATSLAITSLSQATTYSMKLRAGDAAGNWSAWSSPLAVTTPDVSAPSIPAGLKASGNTTGSSFTLIWTQSTDNVAVTAYEVRRDSTSLGTTSGISLNVTGLTQGAAYAMTVRAGDAAGNWSEWSLPLSATTPDLTAPSVPSGIVSPSQTPTTIDLSWNPSTDNIGVTGYDVYMGDVLVGSPTTNAYVVTGLAPSTTYSFTIKAKDAAGNASDASSPYSVKTAPPPPSIPSGLVASDASATSFTLSWTASTGGTGGIASYDIYLNGALVGNSTSPSFALTGLTPSTTYTLTVQSKDTAGNISGASSVLTFTTPADTTPPDAPANLIASAITATSFTLTWTPSSDDVGVAGYTIFNGGVPFGTATAATYNAVGLTPSTIYSISVAAYDAAGNTSTVSDPLSVTTGTNQPPTVSLVTPAANDAVTLPGTITLTAIASDSDGTVAKVEFFSGTTKIGEASAAPYSCTWTATSAGIVSLTAVATDNYGASTISDAVVITLLSGLPYTTDFEAGEGYTTGPLDAQLGWSVPVGSAQVSASDAAHGTQAVILNPDAQINQAFGSSGINPPVVYVDFYAKPAAGADTTASTLFDVGVARVAFVLNGNSGQQPR
jgi:chitodextrinase